MEPNHVLASAIGAHRQRAPASALREHFSCTWFHVLPDTVTGPIAVVPDGHIDLQWIDGVLRVAGPDREAYPESLRPGATVIGLRFQPAAASVWLGAPASEIVDMRVPLEAFWGMDARALAEVAGDAGDPAGIAQRLEQGLAQRARGIEARPDPVALRIREIIEADATCKPDVVRDVRAALDLSERTVRRRCHEAFGYGPKTLHRILRFQWFLRLARRGPASAAGLAAEVGYSDQAHLIREARRMTRLTPATIAAQLAR